MQGTEHWAHEGGVRVYRRAEKAKWGRVVRETSATIN
jgi:hypothetical protein